MIPHRRRLPHFSGIGQPVFLTWRLHGSLPPNRAFPCERLTSGEAFAAMDRLLDAARSGPTYFRQAELAAMMAHAILYNSTVLGHYTPHAWVVMPNHVHLLIPPSVPLPEPMKSLKGITAKRANEMLGRTGEPFWQDEGYDHAVRVPQEFERTGRYVENNPVRAGLAAEAEKYRWSSAAGETGGSPADQGVCPTRP
jgi:REP-associated tyrosine transposase